VHWDLANLFGNLEIEAALELARILPPHESALGLASQVMEVDPIVGTRGLEAVI
jgi:hypothetical protein